MDNPYKLAVIDVGSNSIRLVIYFIEEDRYFSEQMNVKVNARISSHVNNDGYISNKGVDKILQALHRFNEILMEHQVDAVQGVATAAIRHAKNKDEILQKVERETKLPLKVISGAKEAYYGYLAVVYSTEITDGITIDIGGGSTELTYIRNKELLHYHSFPFGAISLTKQFVKGKSITEEEVKQLSSFLEEQFEECTWLSGNSLPVVGIGGTARNIALIHQKKYNSTSDLHQYEIPTTELQDVCKLLKTQTPQQLEKLDGLSKSRVDIIIPASLVIQKLVSIANAPYFMMSRKGLRDGVVYDFITKKENLF